MIIVEDKDTHEIRQFVVVDAQVQLGNITVGTHNRSFTPQRLLAYYAQVESQLHDYATQYPESFKFLPRRAYEYLSKPHLLGTLYQSSLSVSDTSWLADQFVSIPLMDVRSISLPKHQQIINTESTNTWATRSAQSARFYLLQDFRHNSSGNKGWGCILHAKEMESVWNGRNRNDLMQYVKTNLPVFIQVDDYDEFDNLLKWLILLKQANLPDPKLVLYTENHRKWGGMIDRFLDIPNSRLLTSGSTISSLSTVIKKLRKESDYSLWSKRLIYASAYPETQIGDSLSEILSFLLSKNLDASVIDLQRILGSNILSLLPIRPPFLTHIDTTSAIIAEGTFGQTALDEFVGILQVLSAKNAQNIVSVDMLLDDDESNVRDNCAVITTSKPGLASGSSMVLLVDKDETLRIAGWKRTLSEDSQKRNGTILSTLVRSITQSDGIILDSPTHLNTLNKELLKGLRVEDPQIVLSSLHFQAKVVGHENGIVLMCRDDMRALGLDSGDYVLVLDVETSQWWGSIIKSDSSCVSKTLLISDNDAGLFGVTGNSRLDLIKYTRGISTLDKVVIGHDTRNGEQSTDQNEYIYLNSEKINRQLSGKLVGEGTRLFLGKDKREIQSTISFCEPELTPGQIGEINSIATETVFRPTAFLGDFNLIICLCAGSEMQTRDVPITTEYSMKRILSSIANKVPDITNFQNDIETEASRIEIAILSSLMIVENISSNRTEGKLAVVTVSDIADKFTIQKGDIIQPYVTFDDDLSTEEVLVSLIYTLLDAKNNLGKTNLTEAYRAIAELLEDFGMERPTQILMFSNQSGFEDSKSRAFLRAIAKNSRYELDVFGLGNDFPDVDMKGIINELNSQIYPIKEFSVHTFQRYLVTALERVGGKKSFK
ncbi:MAG: hypothetical protein ACTSUB_09800 [Candidatus Thorarchaeota archaeon]